MPFDDVQRTSTQPDAGRCSRSAPDVLVNESRRAPGSSEVSQQSRQDRRLRSSHDARPGEGNKLTVSQLQPGPSWINRPQGVSRLAPARSRPWSQLAAHGLGFFVAEIFEAFDGFGVGDKAGDLAVLGGDRLDLGGDEWEFFGHFVMSS